jgi:lysophospholipase L1-like esterase
MLYKPPRQADYPIVVKCFALGLCAWGIGLAAMAQDTNPPALPAPPAPSAAPTSPSAPPPEPLSTTHADNTRYQLNPALLTDCQSRLDAFSGKPCDVIFIGDSITAGWLGAGRAIWDAKYHPLHALNFGIGGDKTQNVLWRLNNMSIQDLKPKVAVILIGTNNVANTPHEIADGVKAVLANTQLDFPGVKIILISIMPNTRAEDKMMQADALLRSLADDSSVYYLDLVPLMPEVTTTGPGDQKITNYKGLGSDGLHPDASGYKIWADAMDPLLTKLLGGG